jgi:chlorobactene glucosyltransferase
MDPVLVIIGIYLIVLVIVYARRVLMLRDFPVLPKQSTIATLLVSIVVPVRNTASTIETCLISLIGLKYDRKEIIVVDGDSTDGTFDVARRFEDNILLLREPPLEKGWVGKNFACHYGRGFAKGDILLFTDGDTVHDQYCLSSAVHYLVANDLDMLSIWPEMKMRGFWEKTILPFVFARYFIDFEGKKVNSEKSKKFAAFGPYILIRKGAYDSVGGHASIRESTEEDYRLAEVLKSTRKKSCVLSSNGMVSTQMYSSFKEIWAGLVKNSFEGYNSSVKSITNEILLSFFLGVLPFVLLGYFALASLSSGTITFLLLLTVFACLATVIQEAVIYRILGYASRFAIFLPCATIVLIGILTRSTYLARSGKGVSWKGRIYKTGRR